MHTFFSSGVMPVRWSFDFDRVFKRFVIYMQRLKMIENILEATCEIMKLEKMEFCGLRGKTLSADCMKVRPILVQGIIKYLIRSLVLINLTLLQIHGINPHFLCVHIAHVIISSRHILKKKLIFHHAESNENQANDDD